MSSCPGLTLEEWLADNYYIQVYPTEVDVGILDRRVTVLSEEQFKGFVSLFEHHREHVEYLLEDFDEDNQSWRAYNSSAFGFVEDDEDLMSKAYAYLNQYRESRESPHPSQ